MNGIGNTHVGKVREKNEDSFFASNTSIYGLPNLYIVADGMGGHNAGEIASKMSIHFFLRYLEANNMNYINSLELLIDSVKYANDNVYGESLEHEKYYGMGTTFTCCTILDDRLLVAHVGDSRAYLIEENKITQITVDHTYVNELFVLGKITKEEMDNHPKRNVITRALGTEPSIKVDGVSIINNSNYKLCICSDGLTDMILESDITSIVNNNTIENSSSKLINLANNNGGVDNITIVLVEVLI
jgi:PPM family protein phosphatase